MFDMSTLGMKAFRDRIAHGIPTKIPQFDGTSIAAGMLIMGIAVREDPSLAERMVGLALPVPDEIASAAAGLVDDALQRGEAVQRMIDLRS